LLGILVSAPLPMPASAATLTSIGGGVLFPSDWYTLFGQPQYTNLVIDAAGEKISVNFIVPKTGSIHKIGYATRTVTTGDTLKVGLYTINVTSGLPTTNAYGGMVAGTQIVAATDDNVGFTTALGTDATAAAGDHVTATIEFNSFVAGNINLASVSGAGLAQHDMLPYVWFNGTGAYVKQTVIPVLWIEYSDGSYSYIPQMYPWALITANTVASNTAGADQYALDFIPTVGWRLSGIGTYMATSNGAFNVKLYDVAAGSTTTMISAFDPATLNNPSSNARFTILTTTNPVTLTANTRYRLSLEPTTTTSMQIYTVFYAQNAAMNQVAGGTNYFLATTVDNGAWTTFASTQPLIVPFYDQVATGGGAVNSGCSQ